MLIGKDSWHLRVYQWWYEHKYGFPNERGYTNLCPYMRAVMFWAPLRAIFGTWVKIGRVPINAITLPVFFGSLPFLLGYASYNGKMGLFIIYGAVALAAAIIGVIFSLIYLFSKEGKDITSGLRTKVKESGFLDLLGEYFRSAHDRICPEISWRNN